MKTHAEVDAEIARENHAIKKIEQSEFRWNRTFGPADRERRDAQIMEWWAMDRSAEWIAEQVDLTTQRVYQIVHAFGSARANTRRLKRREAIAGNTPS